MPPIPVCPDCTAAPAPPPPAIICLACSGLTPPQPPDTTRPVDVYSEYIGISPGASGGTWVLVEVSNPSAVTSPGFFVDVFVNRTARPTVGVRSSTYQWVPAVAARNWTAFWVHVPAAYTTVRSVDVVIDSTQWVPEYNESNNVFTRWY